MIELFKHEFNELPGSSYKYSGEKPLYDDPQGEWSVTFHVVQDGTLHVPFVHLHTKSGKGLSTQQFKRLQKAIPAIRVKAGMPLYTTFSEDNDRLHRFALKCGWVQIANLPCTDGVVRRGYRMRPPHIICDAASGMLKLD